MSAVYRPYHHPRIELPHVAIMDAAAVVAPDVFGTATASVAATASAAGVVLGLASPRVEVDAELFVENTTNRIGTANAEVTVSCSAIGTRVVAGQQAGMSESGIEHAVERLIQDTPDYRFSGDKTERNFYQRHR